MKCEACKYEHPQPRKNITIISDSPEFIELKMTRLEKHDSNVVNSLKGMVYPVTLPVYSCPKCGTLKIKIGD